tara:strand:+ start:1061 stop:1639 length:579 start_codon:yes stop_codon:yes gene_type:complete
MKQIYKSYFQKSKVFLYPLLGIKKGIRFVPAETYITWNHDLIDSENVLICAYQISKVTKNEEEVRTKQEFNAFVTKYLETNKFYHSRHHTDDLEIIVFNLDYFKHDIKMFRAGKYSKFAGLTKDIILDFFGDIGTISKYMESYLFPEKYYDVYSEILNVPVSLLIETVELCDKPDLDKEDFKKQVLELQLFK